MIVLNRRCMLMFPHIPSALFQAAININSSTCCSKWYQMYLIFSSLCTVYHRQRDIWTNTSNRKVGDSIGEMWRRVWMERDQWAVCDVYVWQWSVDARPFPSCVWSVANIIHFLVYILYTKIPYLFSLSTKRPFSKPCIKWLHVFRFSQRTQSVGAQRFDELAKCF